MTTSTLKFPIVLQEGAIIEGLPQVNSGMISQTIDNTLYLICLLHEPQPLELEYANTKQHGLKLALHTKGSVMRIATKIGKHRWTDSSMSPHLSNCAMPVSLPNKEGLPSILLIVDSFTGKVCFMHVFALSNRFSNQFLKNYHRLYKFPLAPEAYLKACATMDMLYTPQQIGTQLKQASMTISPSVKTK